MKCPLWQAHEKEKRRMLKEANQAKWDREQETNLLKLIGLFLWIMEEPRKEWWAKRLFCSFRERLQGLGKNNWIAFIAELNDFQVCANYTEPKWRRYCIGLRDIARLQTAAINEKKGIV